MVHDEAEMGSYPNVISHASSSPAGTVRGSSPRNREAVLLNPPEQTWPSKATFYKCFYILNLLNVNSSNMNSKARLHEFKLNCDAINPLKPKPV
jgi:hypothetical protein